MAFTVKNWQDAPSTATPLSAAALEDLETRVTAYADTKADLAATNTFTAENTFTADVTLNGGGFTPNYDTGLWIAPATRNNPTLNHQAMYMQARVTGNMGGLVHDAAASELQIVDRVELRGRRSPPTR